MLKEFKKFILRGNVVDLAVGIAIGAAFTGIVQSIVKGFINPLVSLFYKGEALAESSLTVRGQEFLYGEIISNIISFVIVAAVIFFLVVKPINKLTELAIKSDETEAASTKKCPYCFNEISAKATRCGFCTSQLKKAA